MIFMTSNLGAAEMSSIQRPNMGFAASELERTYRQNECDEASAARISRAGLDAARKRFNPEFMNRIDKITVFNPLGEPELRQILAIELGLLREQILNSSSASPFTFVLTEAAKTHLLEEGTDARYGARHLKRAIDRALVHPLSNLVATRQVREGDWISVDYDLEVQQMVFTKKAENLPAYAMISQGESLAMPLEEPELESPAMATRSNRRPGPARGRDVAA
jgi:ATP-dependent Clp protease ATP-binding subunit ClpA